MREPIYKGATRPAMKWGIPLMALVAVFMPTIVVGMWAAILVSWLAAPATLLVLLPIYAWMRWVTYSDDQRLHQMLLKIRLNWLNRNRRFWTARSYSSHRPRETK